MKDIRISCIRNKLIENSLLAPLDIALVGATGVGKSSTINKLFGSYVAEVGEGVEPQTLNIEAYKVSDVFRVYDTAGLGDGLERDREHAKNLTSLLLQQCAARGENSTNKYGLIDLALVILDGSNRDLGTTYKVLEQVVLQCISADRVVVAINQADMAMKGRGWNYLENIPQKELLDFLEEKSDSVKRRIEEATGIIINRPVYYSAYHEYNIDKLFDHIIDCMPMKRRRVE